MESNSPLTSILIAVAGSPNLLRQQLKAIRHYSQSPVRIIVLDDSRRRPHYSNQRRLNTPASIREVTLELGADYHRVPQRRHVYRRRYFPSTTRAWGAGPSLRTADTLNYGMQLIESHPQDYLAILDSDMVPIRPFDVVDVLSDSKICFLPQTRSNGTQEYIYPWPGIFFANLKTISKTSHLNWDCANIGGVALDTGGGLQDWMADQSQVCRKITGLHSNSWKWAEDTPDINDNLRNFLDIDSRLNNGFQFAELFDNKFLHLRAGSNWDPKIRGLHDYRLNSFINFVETELSSKP